MIPAHLSITPAAVSRVTGPRLIARRSPGLTSGFTSGHTNGTLCWLMPDTTHTPELTIEEQLRAAQGVLLLVAELFALYRFTPEGSRHGFSAAASATVAALCRRQGEDLDRLVRSLPARTGNAAARPTRGARP